MTKDRAVFILALIGNLIAFSVLLCLNSFASDNSSFYGAEKGRGYYQYYTSDKLEEADNKTALFSSLFPYYQRPAVPSDEVLYIMPAEEFKELFTRVTNYAVTVRNLDAYSDFARMQSMASKRTEEFGSLYLMYAQLNPPDTNRYISPVSEKAVNNAVGERLLRERENWGLIYFYSPTCPYCAKTKPLIEQFRRTYGWEVEEVDINEKPHIADVFEVTVTPSIRLMDREKNVFKVTNGLVYLDEIEKRIYRYIRYQAGETAPESFAEPAGANAFGTLRR